MLSVVLTGVPRWATFAASTAATVEAAACVTAKLATLLTTTTTTAAATHLHPNLRGLDVRRDAVRVFMAPPCDEASGGSATTSLERGVPAHHKVT
ncbi:hypothetical protein GCM10010170_030720 [Dactylosporangium salmoneum]|uniref:Secreted protein n=1 Tax=Dactylosporangium salmoneum TaxID=53361 RepID=A0ABN3G5T7_9ACTN